MKIKRLLRNILQETDFYGNRFDRTRKKAYAAWVENGKAGLMPPFAKEKLLRMYKNRFGLEILIETGTFLGETVYALRHCFDSILSIELSASLAREAQERFSRYAHIKIIQGDSAIKLPEILKMFNRPILFWLDGHYSGSVTARGDEETPILSELNTIFAHPCKNHTVLIDDVRCFDGTNGYPPIEIVKSIVLEHQYSFTLHDDVIAIQKSLGSA